MAERRKHPYPLLGKLRAVPVLVKFGRVAVRGLSHMWPSALKPCCVMAPRSHTMRYGAALSVLIALSTVALPVCAGVPAPQVGIQDLSQLDVPDYPFSDKADATADVERAFVEARTTGKRVLIDLGANWCADCRILQALMDRPEVHAFLAAHFAIAVVDVGRLNRNLQVPARFGFTSRLDGVPAIIIADPDGKIVNAGHIFALLEARHMTPQDIVNWLAGWAR